MKTIPATRAITALLIIVFTLGLLAALTWHLNISSGGLTSQDTSVLLGFGLLSCIPLTAANRLLTIDKPLHVDIHDAAQQIRADRHPGKAPHTQPPTTRPDTAPEPPYITPRNPDNFR